MSFDAIVGQTVVLGNAPPTGREFRDRDGLPVDPDTVTLTVADPAGTVQTFTGAQLTHPSVGVYETEVLVDQEGYWRVRLEGTVAGDGSAVCEFTVCVAPSLLEVGS